MLLSLSTWAEVEVYLEGAQGIIVPIGSTEQHGPNGLIGTDTICAEVIAGGVGERTGAMVAPVIAVGMAQHHMAFAGSMTLRPSTLVAVVRDVVTSLARHGFAAFFFINGHGGNVATVNAAFAEVYAEASLTKGGTAPGLRCKLVNWWMTPGARKLRKELYGRKDGAHATPSEIAVTQHAFPKAIKNAELDGPAPPWSDFADADDYRRRYPDGRIGSDPSLASPQDGKRLVETAAADLALEYQKFVAGG